MQKIEKTSFIQAVSSVCVSREIFLKLKQQRLWRALMHIVFLAFLCSCFIVIAGHEHMLNKIDKQLDLFEASAGSIIRRNGAFYPEKEPDKAYEIMLSPKMKLVYSPRFEDFKCNWINKAGTTILWFPKFWCVTLMSPDSKNIRLFSGPQDSSMQNMMDVDDCDELMEYLEKRSIQAVKKNIPDDDKSFIVSRIEIERIYLGSIFFYYWIEFCLQTLFMTLLFAVFYRFIGGRNISKLSFKEIFCSGIYAAAPSMLVASFFPALDLPFIPFETVFITGYFIYFLCVLNYLERNAAQQASANKGE